MKYLRSVYNLAFEKSEAKPFGLLGYNQYIKKYCIVYNRERGRQERINMKKIKIAQIGTSKNSHGNDIWKSLLKQADIFDVAGYALPENEREKFPKKMGSFEGYPEMTVDDILNDPEIEAVTVETEEIYLTKYSLMAADAGKHLHMEKPGGRKLSDFEKLIDILKSKNLTFSTGYMYRFNP
ncbi:MAG: Gfo/Idh/MocA family oxidoreductase, partial [Eubacteriales bacterium]|nr:Gfo/Idh/MocA family oxidoreductase [Eubacteriales bacterium]